MRKNRWKLSAAAALMGLFLAAGSFPALAERDDDKEQLEEVYEMWWDGNGEANWNEVEYAYQYQVSLYRDGSRVTTVKTKSESYKFGSKMTKDGEYAFRVRPLAKSSDRDHDDGPWSEYSETFDVDEDYADEMREGKSSSGESGQKPTAAVGWQSDETGYWWQRSDGTYPKNEWMTINDRQYYFDGNGYMVTGWVDIGGNQYYFDENGAYHPEGYQTAGRGEWKQDNIGRWWQWADGTYPVNDWAELDGEWYFFDSTGYMKTGWISWKGQWYYCGPDGKMWKNTYVENQYWADENGVCAR